MRRSLFQAWRPGPCVCFIVPKPNSPNWGGSRFRRSALHAEHAATLDAHLALTATFTNGR